MMGRDWFFQWRRMKMLVLGPFADVVKNLVLVVKKVKEPSLI